MAVSAIQYPRFVSLNRTRRLTRYSRKRYTTDIIAKKSSTELIQKVTVGLPISEFINDILRSLQSTNGLVIEAPPGAGKTTCVPTSILLQDPEWLNGKKIVMLQPRRIAAKSCAKRIASLLGERVGTRSGYRIKLDSKVSRDTRLEVVTEGILIRLLQGDQELKDVGVVVLDEFHERNLDNDLALALCLDLQRLTRPDLRIVIMSATLGGGLAERIQALMTSSNQNGTQIPIIRCQGRSYPVQIKYEKGTQGRIDGEREDVNRFYKGFAGIIAKAVQEEEGDALVFLPGFPEIRKTIECLKKQKLPGNCKIFPLYGNLTPQEQDAAIAPSPPGNRKIVVATNIAETSLTIQGIRVVVDAGYRKIQVHNTQSGMNRLMLRKVSRASAEQRTGRAGRVAPGVCYRYWSEMDQGYLEDGNQPDIDLQDLTSLTLNLASWGVCNSSDLPWLDEPNPEKIKEAQKLLVSLNAIDKNNYGKLTEHGIRMTCLGTHPRLGHMLIRAAEIGYAKIACMLAAVLSEGDIMRASRSEEATDLETRIQLMLTKPTTLDGVKQAARQQAKKAAKDLESRLDKLQLLVKQVDMDLQQQCGILGVLVAMAYPDRIAARKKETTFLMSNGKQVRLFHKGDKLAQSDVKYLAVAETQGSSGTGVNQIITLAAPLTEDDIYDYFKDLFSNRRAIIWGLNNLTVFGKTQTCLGEIVMKEGPIEITDEEAIPYLIEEIRRKGFQNLGWDSGSEVLLTKARWAYRNLGQSSNRIKRDLSEEELMGSLEQWLAPYLSGMRSWKQVKKINMQQVLESLLSWDERRFLQEKLPSHWEAPTGTKVPISYEQDIPSLSVRIQEVFGMQESPTIADGQIKLCMKLLSPRQHPMAQTQDLASFWENHYQQVCKELRGQYPKHYWPDDPMYAQPTKFTKKQMKLKS